MKKAGWRVLFFVVFVKIAFSAFFNLVVFKNKWLVPLAEASNYIIQPGLVAYLVQIFYFW